MAISDNIKLMKTNLKKQLPALIVGLLAAVFFAATAAFNYLVQTKDYVSWSSPDENANYFFSEEFARTGRLAFFDPAAPYGNNILMPRSVRDDFGWLKPVSFLGLLLIYGGIAFCLGTAVIPFLTPLFAALGIILFYFLTRRLFGRRVALISACLLAVFPVYIYYSVRSMFHNVLFVVLLLAASYLAVLAVGKKQAREKRKFLSLPFSPCFSWEFAAAFAAGLLAGLAVITRTSELLWLVPAGFVIWLFYARRFGLMKLILFLAGLFLALLPVIYYNQALYGSIFHGGYNEMNRSLDSISQSGGDLVTRVFSGGVNQFGVYLAVIAKNVFYFGFHPGQSLNLFGNYVVKMFPYLFFPALLGFVLLLGQNSRRWQKKHLVYVLAGLILTAILLFYYGSWRFNDNPDPSRFTIGNSYTRYWLPIYLFLLPLATLAIVKVSRFIFWSKVKTHDRLRQWAASALQAALVLTFAALSLVFVLYGSEEGLASLYDSTLAERASARQVLSLTEPAAVIITTYYDKLLFPYRRIIMGRLPNEEIEQAAKNLTRRYPVYYYNFYLDPAAVNYLNIGKLSAYGLKLELIKKINGQFGLYRLNTSAYEPESQ